MSSARVPDVVGVESPALTIAEAARATGVHRSTIRRHLEGGKLPNAYRDPTANGAPGSWRIPAADLIGAGLRPEPVGAVRPAKPPARSSRSSRNRGVVAELEHWRRRAEVAEAVAAERERSLEDLRGALEALGEAIRVAGGPTGAEKLSSALAALLSPSAAVWRSRGERRGPGRALPPR